MFVRWTTAIAAAILLSSAALLQGARAADKPTDPQIAHIAYTAGVIDINAAKQAQKKARNKDVKAFAEEPLERRRMARGRPQLELGVAGRSDLQQRVVAPIVEFDARDDL